MTQYHNPEVEGSSHDTHENAMSATPVVTAPAAPVVTAPAAPVVTAPAAPADAKK